MRITCKNDEQLKNRSAEGQSAQFISGIIKKEASMSGTTLATYRLPTASSTKIGSVRIVKDRNGKVYADGNKVVSATVVGVHTMLELASGRNFCVLTSDLQRVPKAKGR